MRESAGVMECQKFQITNHKYQTNHNDQNSKFQTCFAHLIPALWNFACSEPAKGSIPQGENLKFVCYLVLGVWDFIDFSSPKHLCGLTGGRVAAI